jgi:hypothetical protein
MTYGPGQGLDSGDEHDTRAARRLTVADVEAIAEATARKVVEIVSPPAGTTYALLSARELARELGVSLDYVYSHAGELGGMRLGSGRRARIRFDLDRARRALESPRHPAKASRRTR